MVQTGDPTNTGKGGESIWGGKFQVWHKTRWPIQDPKFPPINTKSISGWDQGWLEAQNKRGALNGQLWTQLQWEPMVPHIRPPTIPWPQVSRWSAKHNEHLIFKLVSPRYTVFGKVIDGWDTLDELERIPVNPKNHRPLKGVEATINGVTIHANPMAG